METSNKNFEHIKGWGIDANPEDEPNYPMKHYTGDDHNRIRWSRPTKQEETVEILKSTERPSNSAVFGTVSPPKGLSGMLRRYAYTHSENKYRNWLPLLVADRIDVLEGMLSDIMKGRLPKPAAERGWGALWKHKPSLLVRIIAVRLSVFAAIGTFLLYKSKKSNS